jgi:ornithine carbamoyltransferase
MDLHGRSLLKGTDLNDKEFLFLVYLGGRLRADKRRGIAGRRLAGRNIALIFEKTSTRTRSDRLRITGTSARARAGRRQ